MNTRLSVLSAALALSSSQVFAGTVAYDVPAGTVGTQAFGGSLGMDFNVRAPAIRVTQLGGFDSAGDGINGTINVGIFNRATGTQTGGGAVFSGTSAPLVAGSRFLAPSGGSIVLPRGFLGSIVAQGYNGLEPNGNVGSPAIPPWTTNGGPGAQIAFVGTSRWDNPPFGFPNNGDGGPVNRYAAGTFEFELASVAGPKTALWVDAGTAGNQDYGGPLGMDFTVTTPIIITALGVFDDLGNGIAGSLTSEIWSRSGPPAMLASAAFDALSQGVLDDGAQRFKGIPALTLNPGEYTIVGRGFSPLDLNGNAGVGGFGLTSYIDDSGGAIQFVNSSRFGAVTDGFPGIVDAGPANRYYAGTFQYSPIPEPRLAAVFTAGALIMARRRRRAR